MDNDFIKNNSFECFFGLLLFILTITTFTGPKPTLFSTETKKVI